MTITIRLVLLASAACLPLMSSAPASSEPQRAPVAAAEQDGPEQETAGTAEAPPSPAGRIAWASVDDLEQRFVENLLNSPHWPFRVFALFRLERYDGPEVEAFVRKRLADEAWQARCFALRAAHLRRLEVSCETFEKESDGRVIRAALRYGVTLDETRIARGARTLMRNENLDDLMLGLEIAAMSDVQALRKEAGRRLGRLIEHMDDAVAERISRRLARLLGVPDPPDDAAGWRGWLEKRDGQIAFAAVSTPLPAGSAPLPAPPVAEMSTETFSRLIDYLDGLKQRDVDMAIVMDVTSSMIPMIDEAKAGVDSLILFMTDISRSARLAFVAYRDRDHEHVWEGQVFTSDVDRVRSFLANVRITGGADLPEAVLDGVAACGRLKWRPDASRQIILVGDARPHDEDEYPLANLLAEITQAGISVHVAHVPMEANPMYLARMSAGESEHYQREIADHNERTARSFAQIARLGNGDMVTLDDAEQLVPSIMHSTLEQGWWPTFDAFYALYLDLCR